MTNNYELTKAQQINSESSFSSEALTRARERGWEMWKKEERKNNWQMIRKLERYQWPWNIFEDLLHTSFLLHFLFLIVNKTGITGAVRTEAWSVQSEPAEAESLLWL